MSLVGFQPRAADKFVHRVRPWFLSVHSEHHRGFGLRLRLRLNRTLRFRPGHRRLRILRHQRNHNRPHPHHFHRPCFLSSRGRRRRDYRLDDCGCRETAVLSRSVSGRRP